MSSSEASSTRLVAKLEESQVYSVSRSEALAYRLDLGAYSILPRVDFNIIWLDWDKPGSKDKDEETRP